jgi:hypothetical protein
MGRTVFMIFESFSFSCSSIGTTTDINRFNLSLTLPTELTLPIITVFCLLQKLKQRLKMRVPVFIYNVILPFYPLSYAYIQYTCTMYIVLYTVQITGPS